MYCRKVKRRKKMAIQPVFENIRIRAEKGSFSEKIKVDCKTDVESSSVAEAIGVTARVLRGECSCEDGKIVYAGKAVFYFFYENADGNLCKRECSEDFEGSITAENVSPDCVCDAEFITERAEINGSGIKISLSANVIIKAEVSCYEEVEALSGGSGMFVKATETSVPKSYGVKKTTLPVEQQFSFDYPVKEVLCHRADAVVTAVQCGVGCIIADGEIYCSAMVLQKDGKSGIIREDVTIPFRAEIDCEEAMPVANARAEASVGTFKTDITVDAENGKSEVLISVGLRISGEAFGNEEVSLVDDAFCLKNELELSSECRDVRYVEGLFCEKYAVTGRAGISEVPSASKVVAVCGERAEIISLSTEDDKVVVDGVLSATVFLLTEEGKMLSIKADAPFNTHLETQCGSKMQKVSVLAENARARLISLTELEIEADMIFCSQCVDKKTIKCIRSVGEGCEKPVCDSAISIFIPIEGEDLWSISKRLGADPEKLTETNPDLSFPLTGRERIAVYRQR